MAPPLLPITRLIACPSCAEHFKSNESQCPHCGVDNRSAEGRTARAATAVLMGIMLSGCPDKEPDSTSTSGTDSTGTGTDSGSGGSSSSTGETTGTTFMPEPEYGVPVTTSGPEPDYGVPGTDTATTDGTGTGTTTTTTTTTGGEPLYGAGAT